YLLFNDTTAPHIHTLSLHDALPISQKIAVDRERRIETKCLPSISPHGLDAYTDNLALLCKPPRAFGGYSRSVRTVFISIEKVVLAVRALGPPGPVKEPAALRQWPIVFLPTQQVIDL